ncbi:MAG TPA: aldehyde dehydrogenase family protein [Baekduia sp.]
MAATSEPVTLDALGPAGRFQARERTTIEDVAGDPVAELSLVPSLFVSRAMAALRKADPLPLDERVAALARAGAAYREQTLDGLTPGDYERLVSRVSGLPIAAVRSAADAIARQAGEVHRSVQRARPIGAANDWRDPLTRTGRAVWTRRGEVFAVLAPGNTPAVHGQWLEALALGYRVAVRPSRREPFTPYRLIAALRAAGFGDDQVVFLPTDHDAADAILRDADLSMAYGGADLMRKYASLSTMLPQGPGRSKILLTADVDWRDHLDMVVASVSQGGGTWCTNTTAVFVEGDPGPLAAALAARLATLPSHRPEDDGAVLPVHAVGQARAVEQYLRATAAGATSWLGGDGIVDELGDGSAVLRPAVHQLDSPAAEQARVELAFPNVWVVPWTRAAGLGPLKDTLVLTAVTRDERLLDELLAEPTVSNLYIGDHPTCWYDPSVPHDGYLADFLMRTKGVIRD